MSEKPDDTRQRLLEAAGEVFAEKGYQAATVREICSRAGANLAAVNYYFGDKQRLYVEVVNYAHRGHGEQPLPEFPPETPSAEKLWGFVEHMLVGSEVQECPSWGRRLMMREMAEPSEACGALVDAFVRPKAELLGRILAELLPPDTSPADRHLIAYSIVGQCLFHRMHRPIALALSGEELYRSFNTAWLADHITRFTLAAIGRGVPLGGTGVSPVLHSRHGQDTRATGPLGDGTGGLDPCETELMGRRTSNDALGGTGVSPVLRPKHGQDARATRQSSCVGPPGPIPSTESGGRSTS
jgi:AcrR family transcriptional regulator